MSPFSSRDFLRGNQQSAIEEKECSSVQGERRREQNPVKNVDGECKRRNKTLFKF